MRSPELTAGNATSDPSKRERGEDDKEEERERYRELLEELRTIIPGAQVLFAFLLTAPFSARFSEIDFLGKIVFAVSLVEVAVATVLFLAPAAYHRLASRHDRHGRLRFGVQTAVAGMSLLGLSITCAVFVVVRFLFASATLAATIAAVTAALALVMWYILPLYNRLRLDDAPETQVPSKRK